MIIYFVFFEGVSQPLQHLQHIFHSKQHWSNYFYMTSLIFYKHICVCLETDINQLQRFTKVLVNHPNLTSICLACSITFKSFIKTSRFSSSVAIGSIINNNFLNCLLSSQSHSRHTTNIPCRQTVQWSMYEQKLSVYLSIYLSIYLSMYIYIHIYIYTYIYIFLDR